MGIYVWGTGCGASELVEAGLAPEKIAAFVDSFPMGSEFLGRPVLLPEELPKETCDLLIITSRQGDAIESQCRELGILPEKLLFLKNSATITDKNDRCSCAHLLPPEVGKKLFSRQRMVTTPRFLADARLPEDALSGDYVRLATLELLTRTLQNVPGAAAELGVYRGFFAGCINRLLPERKLYLFDSFQGFLPDSGAAESFQQAHANTATPVVLAAMPHPETVELRPGFFPQSLNGLEERFCLVSLDVDFGETTLEGLRYFWPRLNSGGYLLLHDYHNLALPGVKKALDAFQAEWGSPLPGVPLPDVNGTLVLCK